MKPLDLKKLGGIRRPLMMSDSIGFANSGDHIAVQDTKSAE